MMKNTAAMIGAAVLATFAMGGGAAAGDYMIVAHAKALDGGSFEDRSGNLYRLHAVDAPELAQECHGPSGDAYGCGEEARKALAKMLDGIVTCNPVGAPPSDPEAVRLVRCHDFASRDIGGLLIAAGWALPDRSAGVAMDYVWGEMEAEARALGLWQGRFVQPWRWRAGARL